MNSTSEIERQKEAAIDALRLKAFETNSDADRQAYFDAVSKWFQDRHIRRVNAERVPFLPVQGAVKKLEWRKGRAETPFGPYHVIEETNDDEPFWFVMFNSKAAARCGTHDAEESAIFAAQADYEARIIAALEPSAARDLALEEGYRQGIEAAAQKAAEMLVFADTTSTADREIPAAIRALSSPDHADAGKVEGDGLPQDVINLVIAAREVWEEADTLSYYHTDEDFSQRVKALDKALEPFGERVPFENEPYAPASEGAE